MAVSRFRTCFAASSFIAFFSGGARASNILEVGEAGSEQMARGGAWVARASDPLAAYYNPAGLAGQATRFSLNANVVFHHTCMTRVLAANDTTNESGVDPNTALFPRVCNDIEPFPNPQLAFNYRVSDRLGIGLSILGPNAAGKSHWPEFVNGAAPAPQRYLFLKASGIQLNPTIAIGYEVIDGLRIGGSFQWGMAQFHLANSVPVLNADSATPQTNDAKALLQVKDYFIPGFTLGALYSPIDELDIAAWYRYSAPIDAKGDVVADTNYFTRQVQGGDTSGTKGTDSSDPGCGFDLPSKVCASGKNASVRVVIPMEAKLGFRFHKPRSSEVRTSHKRDPLSQDLFDAEVDFTWSNNSALDTFRIRFPGNAEGDGVIPINGVAGGTVPPSADVTKGFKDVFGVRVGGDYNILPDKLAIRGGVFAESNGQNQQYQHIDFAGAARFGLALGGTYRLRMGGEDRTRALEFSFGYGHIFFGKQDQGASDRNAPGLTALAGVACNPTGNAQPGDTCSDGRMKYRTNWPVNLGTIWNSVNTINVGVAYRF